MTGRCFESISEYSRFKNAKMYAELIYFNVWLPQRLAYNLEMVSGPFDTKSSGNTMLNKVVY